MSHPTGVSASSPLIPPLCESQVHPAIRERIRTAYAETLEEVQAAIAQHSVVVVGMSINPHVKKARQLLDKAAIPHHYLEYGGYLSDWKKRLVLKQWSGWPTFPMVFVKGVLVGGASDLAPLIESGEVSAASLSS